MQGRAIPKPETPNAPPMAAEHGSIGRSEGLEIQFDVRDADGSALDPLRVFTTRPDTVMGVTFVSIDRPKQ